jgi:membrane fusion protein, multidrug efflux system
MLLRPLRLYLLSCVLGLLLLAGCEKKSTSTPKGGRGNAPFIVDIIRIAPQPFRETLSATGSLVAREAVQLQAERPGVVREISFVEGKLMSAGEVLVSIDDSELQAQLTRARAQLSLAASAEARQRTLLQSKGISAAEFDESRAAHDVAKAEVKLIEAQIAKTKIRAPFDGIAGLRNISVGSYLTAGTTICTFQDVKSLKIDFSLPERYLPYLRPGQNVTFRVAGRSENFTAAIAAIEPAVDVQTRTLLIRATVPNEETRLLPGSFAEVEVTLEEVKDAILIPAIALMPGLQQPTVFLHRNGEVEQRKVLAGLRTSDAVQILEGLKPGDELITSGILQIRPGLKVQAKPATSPVRGPKGPENPSTANR